MFQNTRCRRICSSLTFIYWAREARSYFRIWSVWRSTFRAITMKSGSLPITKVLRTNKTKYIFKFAFKRLTKSSNNWTQSYKRGRDHFVTNLPLCEYVRGFVISLLFKERRNLGLYFEIVTAVVNCFRRDNHPWKRKGRSMTSSKSSVHDILFSEVYRLILKLAPLILVWRTPIGLLDFAPRKTVRVRSYYVFLRKSHEEF